MPLHLSESRRAAAEAEFEAYDFGDQVVVATNGWEDDDSYTRLTRVVFLTDPDDPAGPSVAAHVNVDFANRDCADVIGVEAILGGDVVGHRPGATLTP